MGQRESASIDLAASGIILRRRAVRISALGLLCALLGTWLWQFFSDVVPPEVPALRLERWPEAPDEENGAWLHREAMIAVDHGAFMKFQGLEVTRRHPRFLDLDGEPIAEVVAALGDPLREVVAAQARALGLLARAADAPAYAPEWHFSRDQLGNVGGLWFVVHLAVLSHWFEGDTDAAWNLLLAKRELLRAASERPRSSVDLHTELAGQRMFFGPLRVLLASSPDRTPEQLRRWLATLGTPLLAEDWRSRQIRRDALLFDSWLADPASVDLFGLDPNLLSFRPGRTRARFAALHDDWLDSADEWWEAPRGPSGRRWTELWISAIGGNAAGDRLAYQWSYQQTHAMALPVEARGALLMDELARAVIALRLHRHEHGEWPECLEALVPEFLPALPRDPHDPAGGALHWSRSERALWSVGHHLEPGGPAGADVPAWDRCSGPRPTVRLREAEVEGE